MSTAISSLLSTLAAAQPNHHGTESHSAVEPGLAAHESRGHSGRSNAGFDASAATERLRSQVRSVGPHYRTALITGERGARKEEVARALHWASPVAKGPFVVCDSGGLESLLRSNGAAGVKSSEDRAICRNLARTAHGGTIFFPELGLFSVTAQKELLHFLDCLKEEHGSRIRVIASVSGEVQALVTGGTLLNELREKIGVVELAVAPLRERVADFAEVAHRVFEQIAAQSGEATLTISEDALRELQRRGWPGNDRELESTLRMAALMSGGKMIQEGHLPPATDHVSTEVEQPAHLQTSSMKLQDVVDAHVQEVLRKCEGNKLKAAEVLGISRSTLYRMLDTATVAG